MRTARLRGIKFTITGNGVNETVTTAKNGTVDLDLLPGTYTVTEQTDDKYETQAAQTVTIVSGKTSTVTYNNTLRRGDLKVTKTAEDGLNEGVKFHLYGISYCGLPVDEYAVTNASGIAVFDDVLIGTGYTSKKSELPIDISSPTIRRRLSSGTRSRSRALTTSSSAATSRSPRPQRTDSMKV